MGYLIFVLLEESIIVLTVLNTMLYFKILDQKEKGIYMNNDYPGICIMQS